MHTGGVVLCGGRSTRMGMAKAMLPFGDELMLPRVVRLLEEVVDPIVVVAAPGQQLPPLPREVPVVLDRREGRGPLEGILAGLSALAGRADAAYVTSCDVPLLAPAFVRRMIELVGEHEVAVPRDGEFHHPLAAVYRIAVLPHIESLLAADQLRPRDLFQRVNTREVPVDELRTVDRELATLWNLNRPEDYFAALAAEGIAADPAIVERLKAGG